MASHIGEDLSSMPDEHIDFDALWAWPTPAVGTPRFGLGAAGPSGDGVTPGGGLNGGTVPGVSDASIPLYGVVND